jgi:hypothetical protein
MYDMPAYSVWPDDGFTKMCECEKCKSKDTPERGVNGVLSDYVWEYVNNVATEISKTHPNKYIIGGAYGSYFLPPKNIEKLNPNVIIHLVNGRRRYYEPKLNLTKNNFSLEERMAIAQKWSEISEGKVINFMNHGGSSNTPNIIAEDIKKTKNLFIGEDVWVMMYKSKLANPAFNHLNYYVSSMLWWNPNLDIDELLNEYYGLFYGPAADDMKIFIDYFEENQADLGSEKKINELEKVLELFEIAQQKVDKDSIYGKRIALFEKGLEKYKLRYSQLLIGRKSVPSLRLKTDKNKISDVKIDGVLDEEFWETFQRKLVSNLKNQEISNKTQFRIGIDNDYIFFGIKSKFDPGSKLIYSTTKKDDPNIYEGEYVDIFIETPSNSYYQISINPNGSVLDYDWSNSGYWGSRWDSNLELKTKIDNKKGIWYIEAKIPFTSSLHDPLNQIIGKLPEKENFPWYFNVCRKHISNKSVEYSAFSPTLENNFNIVTKFALMYL